MKRSAAGTWLGVPVYLLALFATPVHLALEAHEWRHEASEDGHDHHDSGQGTHPAVDHEVTALAKAPRFAAVPVVAVVLHLGVRPPDVRTWVPVVEPEAQSPPDVYASPPRSPRSPPV